MSAFMSLGGGVAGQRVAALQRYGIAAGGSAALALLTDLTARLFTVPIAAIELVSAGGEVFSYKHGLTQAAAPILGGFGAAVIAGNDVLLVEDAAKDDRFADNPLVTGPPKVRFYAGAPLRTPAGARIGALCIMDTVPRALVRGDSELLAGLAGIVIDEFELRLKSAELQGETERSRSAEESADHAFARLESLEYELALQSVARTLTDMRRERRGAVGPVGPGIVPVSP